MESSDTVAHDMQLWDLDIIDSADRPSDIDNVFEMEPIKSIRVGTDSSIQVNGRVSPSSYV